MKKILVLLWLTCSFFSAKTQNEIKLHLAPRLGTSVFALNQAVSHPGGTYQMKFIRYEFYISDIQITHDGGQITPCTDVTLLVRPATDSIFSLGQFPNITNIEAVKFSVGVPQSLNHADPAAQPPGSPLAPQNPSMHWGWSAGYRFAAIEGNAGTNLAQQFEIHALGDANYKTQTIITGAEQVNQDLKMIHLIADYSQAVKSVNLSTGPIVHGSSGAAITVLNNFQGVVFKAEASSSTIDPKFEGTFTVAPNPVVQTAPVVSFSLPNGYGYELTLIDIAGKVLERRSLEAGENQTLVLDKITVPGIFLIHLWQHGSPVAVEKLVVMN
ncbi:MAG: hypothetical protein JNJ57_01650 [Saprospiraceae bacterium]|nr:hypothetical protein [Saprospiraceae bacterium]